MLDTQAKLSNAFVVMVIGLRVNIIVHNLDLNIFVIIVYFLLRTLMNLYVPDLECNDTYDYKCTQKGSLTTHKRIRMREKIIYL